MRQLSRNLQENTQFLLLHCRKGLTKWQKNTVRYIICTMAYTPTLRGGKLIAEEWLKVFRKRIDTVGSRVQLAILRSKETSENNG